MSAVTHSPLPSVSAPRPRRSAGPTIIGSILIVLGAMAAISGAVLLFLFGGDRVLASEPHHVVSDTSALVTDLGTIANTNGVAAAVASPTLHVTAGGSPDRPVFIGIGPADAVDRYLAGVSTDRVTGLELSEFVLDTVHRPGAAPTGTPATQTFWVASAQTTAVADLAWEIQDGNYSVVIMNAAGSIGIDTQVRAGLGLPGSSAIWEMVAVVGAALLIIGVTVIAVGSRGRNIKP